LSGSTRAAFGVLRVGLALGIVAWVLSTAGLQTVALQLAHVSPLALLLVLGFLLVENLIKVVNWQLMLAAMLRRSIAFAPLLKANLAGCFLGTIVPSSAGTDALRALYARGYFGGHLVVHAASMVTQNVFNWFGGSLLGLGMLAWLWHREQLPLALNFITLLLLGVAIAAPTLYFLLSARRSVLVLGLRRVRPRWYKFRRAARRFIDALLIFDEAHISVPRVLALSLLGVTAQGLAWMAAGEGLGLQLPLACWILMVPVNGIATLVPLSISGFGFNQAAHLAVLVAFGVDPAQAVAVSALMMLSSTVYNLVLGGLGFSLAGRRRPSAQSPTQA
jgi:uncharacterized protein (TIRG00374 family)